MASNGETGAELVKALRDTEEETGLFQTYADVLAFAGMPGISRTIR